MEKTELRDRKTDGFGDEEEEEEGVKYVFHRTFKSIRVEAEAIACSIIYYIPLHCIHIYILNGSIDLVPIHFTTLARIKFDRFLVFCFIRIIKFIIFNKEIKRK